MSVENDVLSLFFAIKKREDEYREACLGSRIGRSNAATLFSYLVAPFGRVWLEVFNSIFGRGYREFRIPTTTLLRDPRKHRDGGTFGLTWDYQYLRRGLVPLAYWTAFLETTAAFVGGLVIWAFGIVFDWGPREIYFGIRHLIDQRALSRLFKQTTPAEVVCAAFHSFRVDCLEYRRWQSVGIYKYPLNNNGSKLAPLVRADQLVSEVLKQVFVVKADQATFDAWRANHRNESSALNILLGRWLEAENEYTKFYNSLKNADKPWPRRPELLSEHQRQLKAHEQTVNVASQALENHIATYQAEHPGLASLKPSVIKQLLKCERFIQNPAAQTFEHAKIFLNNYAMAQKRELRVAKLKLVAEIVFVGLVFLPLSLIFINGFASRYQKLVADEKKDQMLLEKAQIDLELLRVRVKSVLECARDTAVSNPQYARMLLLAVPPSFPDYGAARFGLGLQLTLRGNAEAAIPYFKQVPVDSPAYGDACYELGRLHALNHTLAERYFLQVSPLTSEKFRDASYELGNIAFVRGEYSRALGFLRWSGRSQNDPLVAAARTRAQGGVFTLSDLRSQAQSSLAGGQQSGQANPEVSSALLFKRGALKVRTTDDIQAARLSDDLVDENFVDSEVDDLRVRYGAAHAN